MKIPTYEGIKNIAVDPQTLYCIHSWSLSKILINTKSESLVKDYLLHTVIPQSPFTSDVMKHFFSQYAFLILDTYERISFK